MSLARPLTAIVAVFVATCAPGANSESYHACTGFIDAVPAVVATQGTWCLRKDLSTAITSGNAITIAANNVTIDCNGFKIGGLAAGSSSQAQGIYAFQRHSATLRNCSIRGFHRGIALQDGGGHLVADNRLDNILFNGIFANGDGNVVQRNRIYDTGGVPGSAASYGIHAAGNILGNTVSGVFATSSSTYPTGIHASGPGTEVRGNRVSRLAVNGTGYAIGINAQAYPISISGNNVASAQPVTGWGIFGSYPDTSICAGNIVYAFATDAFVNCDDAGGNAGQ